MSKSEYQAASINRILQHTGISIVFRCCVQFLRTKWHLLLDEYILMISKHTHTRLTALFPGISRWAGTRKVKPIWILLEQETVSGSGISWAICKSAPSSRQITMPAPHRSVFLQAGCPSCCPTNSVKALKAFASTLSKKLSVLIFAVYWF